MGAFKNAVETSQTLMTNDDDGFAQRFHELCASNKRSDDSDGVGAK
jgi:hypothetical protein